MVLRKVFLLGWRSPRRDTCRRSILAGSVDTRVTCNPREKNIPVQNLGIKVDRRKKNGKNLWEIMKENYGEYIY